MFLSDITTPPGIHNDRRTKDGETEMISKKHLISLIKMGAKEGKVEEWATTADLKKTAIYMGIFQVSLLAKASTSNIFPISSPTTLRKSSPTKLHNLTNLSHNNTTQYRMYRFY